MTYVLPFVIAMSVAMALLPLLARVAGRLHMMDSPGDRKIHSAPIPRVGGIAIAIAVAAALAVQGDPVSSTGVAFLCSACVLLAVGVTDDRFDLDYRWKFAGQAIAIGIVVIAGGVSVSALSPADRLELPRFIAMPITFLFLLGVTNAMNLSDGLDGLAGGMALVCMMAVAWLAHLAGHSFAMTLSLAFAGAVLGFLRFNTYPAIVFLGDGGSQLLGFSIGVLSLLATQSAETAVSAALPLLLLAVPILDTLQVMVTRVRSGRSPFSADRRHLHHRLLARGFAHHEAVMILYAMQGSMFLVAYALRFESDLAIFAAFITLGGAALAALGFAEHRDWVFRRGLEPTNSPSIAVRIIGRLHRPDGLGRWASLGVGAGIVAYGALVARRVGALPNDLRISIVAIAAGLAAVIVVRRHRPVSFVDKALLYIAAAALVFCDASAPIEGRALAVLDWALPMTIAFLTAVALRAAGARRFTITPLDLLVVFVAFVLPSLPGLSGTSAAIGFQVAKLFVLFYAIEVLSTVSVLDALWVRFGAAALMGAVAVAAPVATP